MAVVNIAGLVYYTQTNPADWAGLFFLTAAVSRILVSRFILDLRDVYSAQQEQDVDHGSNLSGMQYAVHSIVGTIGARLATEDSVWVSGQSDDVNADEAEATEMAVLSNVEDRRVAVDMCLNLVGTISSGALDARMINGQQ
ncbi:hypothetical protein EIP91_002806 [Steccherinum ochraceum]|uniref:Uncharacterized protein n=1 Tax=Steccherinum ochraceum TaxID=92696 RepID=A0A4R0RBD9_9APHY|nr:hypothetical protein EIP91_002806 [Steccherinum ochraceum]